MTLKYTPRVNTHRANYINWILESEKCMVLKMGNYIINAKLRNKLGRIYNLFYEKVKAVSDDCDDMFPPENQVK